MPDLSQDDIHANAPLAVASERQIWNSLSPEGRAQILGQSIAGESNISNKESVYQKDTKIRSYESMDYSSLPQHVQYDVSHLLHEMGYFKETYGATVYEVDGDDRFECKDCEEPFVSEEDLRVHRKINHDDNGESETESQEAYSNSLDIDPSVTKDNLSWARRVIRGESSRVSYPQNDPPTPMTPKLPKGKKEYDNNPNSYFYDNKLFKRGTRGNYYGQDGVALTEAKHLISLESKILDKYGWESTKDIEKNKTNREVFASEVAKVVRVESLHPRTIKIIDSVNKPFLVNTLQSLGAKWAKEADAKDRGDIDPFIEEEPVLDQDYNPEHPHEHNVFDLNFGDKVAEEQEEETVGAYDDMKYKKQELNRTEDVQDNTAFDYQKGEEQEEETVSFKKHWGDVSDLTDDEKDETVDFPKHWGDKEEAEEYEWKKGQENQKDVTRTCATCGFYTANEYELDTHKRSHANEDHPVGETWQATNDGGETYEYVNEEDSDGNGTHLKTVRFVGYDDPEGKSEGRSGVVGESRATEDQWKGGIDPKELEDAHDKEIEQSGHPENWTLSGEPRQIGAVRNDVAKEDRRDEADSGAFDSALSDQYNADAEPQYGGITGRRTQSQPTGNEDFPFEEDATTTTVTAEPELLDNVNTDALKIEGEQYDPEEEYDIKADEARTISNYVGATQTKAGESIQNILEGAIDVPVERESVNETIYNRKLEGYHEDKIARELAVYHNIEYNQAIEKIRSIEVKDSDRTAKTLYGKKFADCNESEIEGMKILGGEVKKKSTGKRNDRRK